jgi:anti-sigma factor RsiW
VREHCSDEVLSGYLDGDLAPADAGQIAEHVATCPSCRRNLAQVREIRDAAASLEQMAPPERTWQAIQERLQRRGGLAPVRVTPWAWLGVPTLAAAALLVAFVWGRQIVAHRTRGPGPVSPQAAAQACGDSVEVVYQRYVADIDSAIRECEAAMQENPGNDRVRRAYQGAQTSRANAMDRLVSGGD